MMYNIFKKITGNVHRLIHATDEETINRHLDLLKLNTKQLEKVNKLRGNARLQLIAYGLFL